MDTIDYKKQAEDFLKSTNTVLTVEYDGTYNRNNFGVRDNYKITLKRDSREYSFIFSQSLQCSGKWHIKQKSPSFYHKEIYAISHEKPRLGLAREFVNWNDLYIISGKIKHINDLGNINSLHERVKNQKAEIVKNNDFKEPSAYDILACLTKYDPGLFEDFCADYGYDEDSRKGYNIYEAVRNEYLNLAKLFTDSELEEMQEIQ